MSNERVNVRDIVGEMVEGGSIDVWSKRLMVEGHKHGVYRQCSLGWHGECSQRREYGPDCECNCTCHVEPREFDMDVFDESGVPEGVVEVEDYEGNTWVLSDETLWRRSKDVRYADWEALLRRFGPVTEVTIEETP